MIKRGHGHIVNTGSGAGIVGINALRVAHALGAEWMETRLLASGGRTNPWYQECSEKIIRPGDLIFGGQLRQGRHERLRDKFAAVGPEMARLIRIGVIVDDLR